MRYNELFGNGSALQVHREASNMAYIENMWSSFSVQVG